MVIKTESYKIFSKIYCPIVPAPLELFFGDRCRSESLELFNKNSNRYDFSYFKMATISTAAA